MGQVSDGVNRLGKGMGGGGIMNKLLTDWKAKILL